MPLLEILLDSILAEQSFLSGAQAYIYTVSAPFDWIYDYEQLLFLYEKTALYETLIFGFPFVKVKKLTDCLGKIGFKGKSAGLIPQGYGETVFYTKGSSNPLSSKQIQAFFSDFLGETNTSVDSWILERTNRKVFLSILIRVPESVVKNLYRTILLRNVVNVSVL